MYSFLAFILRPVVRFLFNIKVHGEFKHDADESLIICANHRHFLDPIFLALIIDEKISFMGKKELFENKIFDKFLRSLNAFPVDREGSDVKTLMQTVKRIKAGEIVGIFIEGTRVKFYDEKNAKAGAIVIAKLAKAKIQPIYIKSSYKIFARTDIYFRDKVEIKKRDNSSKAEFYQIEAQKLLRYIYKGDQN